MHLQSYIRKYAGSISDVPPVEELSAAGEVSNVIEISSMDDVLNSAEVSNGDYCNNEVYYQLLRSNHSRFC